LDESTVNEIAFWTQDAIVASLVDKIIQWIGEYQPTGIGICGGVSANQYLHHTLVEELRRYGYDLPVYRPVKGAYCTDNAGMIGLVGLLHYLDTI
jgi:N6-L-threonylcarbamoyladenine synthase